MEKVYRVTDDIFVLPDPLPLPGVGVLPINAFVVMAKEPVLVDTGIGISRNELLKGIESIIDLREIRWVWLSHDDGDHTGAVQQVLELAPQARLATHAFSALRMALSWPVPMDRVRVLRPGEKLDVGDRALTTLRPLLYDNPMSVGFYDDKSGALFSVDSFGAILPDAVDDARSLSEEELAQGMVGWATFDSPWAHLVEMARFEEAMQRLRELEPKLILSSHLPPARGMLETLLRNVASVPLAPPSVPPDQQAFEALVGLAVS
jgi:flavorubredoxin